MSQRTTTPVEDIEWIGRCLADVTAGGYGSIEALHSAQDEWIDAATSLVEGSIVVDPSCNSWWNGANVPGKKRRYLAYPLGIPEFRRVCDEIADDGYPGFRLTGNGQA